MEYGKFVHYVETHMLMFDMRPCGLGVRCYNKNVVDTPFHYGYGKNHRDAVEDWIQKAKWRK